MSVHVALHFSYGVLKRVRSLVDMISTKDIPLVLSVRGHEEDRYLLINKPFPTFSEALPKIEALQKEMRTRVSDKGADFDICVRPEDEDWFITAAQYAAKLEKKLVKFEFQLQPEGNASVG